MSTDTATLDVERTEEIITLVRRLADGKRYWRAVATTARASRDRHRHERDDLRRRLDECQRIDGNLLVDVITRAVRSHGWCPEWFTDEGARAVARRAVTDLAQMTAVIVFGSANQPWPVPDSPDRNDTMVTTPNCGTTADDDQVANASATADEWFEWAVFRAAADDNTTNAFLVAEAHDRADADRLADHVDRAWVARRRVITEGWVPVV